MPETMDLLLMLISSFHNVDYLFTQDIISHWCLELVKFIEKYFLKKA